MRSKPILVLAMVVLLVASASVSAYSDGDGSTENPYQIANVADFQQLTIDDPNWNESFILTADVNLAGITLTPVGNSSTRFTGVFDGNDNIISNAVIYQPGSDYIGLFGYVGSGGQIRNLGVEDVNMTGGDTVGGLVGSSGGTLTSCYATGSVSGDWWDVGGLVGFNGGTLTACYATGSVSGDVAVGGLVGGNGFGTLITSCYATGAVSGDVDVGGLVGLNGGTLTSCYATGSVSGDEYVGGLVGFNWGGTLTSCYATGSVTGTGDYVGGLVGVNAFAFGTLTSCYATGSVTGTGDCVGGLVGENHGGTLTSCYATGSVSGDGDVGGLVGYNEGGTITACFWDTQTCLPATVGIGSGIFTGVTGKTTAEMKTLSTFTSAGWDFTSVWVLPLGQYPMLFIRPAGDLNYDKKVDFADFAILADNWLAGI